MNSTERKCPECGTMRGYTLLAKCIGCGNETFGISLANQFVLSWISVKERLPEERTMVLIVDGGEVSVGQYSPTEYHPTGWWDYLSTDINGCEVECHNVTHWMPLPEPPKE